MEFWSTLVLITVFALAIFGLALCVAILFARVGNAEELALEKSEPKALQDALAKSEGTAARVDNALLNIEKFREGIHSEMQRFYAIMRRNEKALEKGQAEETAENSGPPDEIPVESLRKQQTEEDQLSRAELRKLARDRGHRV